MMWSGDGEGECVTPEWGVYRGRGECVACFRDGAVCVAGTGECVVQGWGVLCGGGECVVSCGDGECVVGMGSAGCRRVSCGGWGVCGGGVGGECRGCRRVLCGDGECVVGGVEVSLVSCGGVGNVWCGDREVREMCYRDGECAVWCRGWGVWYKDGEGVMQGMGDGECVMYRDGEVWGWGNVCCAGIGKWGWGDREVCAVHGW